MPIFIGYKVVIFHDVNSHAWHFYTAHFRTLDGSLES